MGQKVFKDNSITTFEGTCQTQQAYESYLAGSSLKEFTDIRRHTLKPSCAGSSQGCLHQDGMQSACEFKDYCNHLYYIDDRCDCSSVWKKTTGLVLPTST